MTTNDNDDEFTGLAARMNKRIGDEWRSNALAIFTLLHELGEAQCETVCASVYDEEMSAGAIALTFTRLTDLKSVGIEGDEFVDPDQYADSIWKAAHDNRRFTLAQSLELSGFDSKYPPG